MAKSKKCKKVSFKKTRKICKLSALLLAMLGLVILFQLIKKPTEIIGFAFNTQKKSIYKTWKTYRPLFESHSTEIIKPKFLAALAQVESGGDPLASPNWSFKFPSSFFNLFSPLSSSVGLYQFTTATFNKASRLCIHRGNVVKTGKWYDIQSCWFNALYTRLIPSDSIEVASAYLDVSVKKIMRAFRLKRLTKEKQEKLASVIHLCGYGRGKTLVRNNFNLNNMKNCGSHNVKNYYLKIKLYESKI